jgi:hypothetical protein
MELFYNVLEMAGTGLCTAIFLTIFSRIGLFPLVIFGMLTDEES